MAHLLLDGDRLSRSFGFAESRQPVG